VTAGARVARKRRVSLFVLLRALGYGDDAFLERFVRHFDFLEGQWEKERTSPRPVRRPCSRSTSAPAPASRSRLRPHASTSRTPSSTEALRPHASRPLQAEPQARPEIERISELFGIELERPVPGQGVLSPSEILASATYMLHLALHMADGDSTYRIDDQDHFANRRIRSVGELIRTRCASAFHVWSAWSASA